VSDWQGCKCPNCGCRKPTLIGTKVPVPPISNIEQLELFMGHHFLVLLSDIHKQEVNIMTGRVTVEFQYDPVYLRDEMKIEWVPRG
jgi:hypothetical protein